MQAVEENTKVNNPTSEYEGTNDNEDREIVMDDEKVSLLK